MENLHIIDLNKRKKIFEERLSSLLKDNLYTKNFEKSFLEFMSLEEKVNICLTSDCENKLTLGRLLIEIKKNMCFTYLKYKTFEEYCETEIGISKSFAYKLIKCYEFSKSGDVATLDCSKFTISQLIELVSLDKDLLSLVTPTMTVKEIRALKTTEISANTNEVEDCSDGCSDDCDCASCQSENSKNKFKLCLNDFNMENSRYDFDYFTKFEKKDLAVIAYQLYVELNSTRSRLKLKTTAEQNKKLGLRGLLTEDV